MQLQRPSDNKRPWARMTFGHNAHCEDGADRSGPSCMESSRAYFFPKSESILACGGHHGLRWSSRALEFYGNARGAMVIMGCCKVAASQYARASSME